MSNINYKYSTMRRWDTLIGSLHIFPYTLLEYCSCFSVLNLQSFIYINYLSSQTSVAFVFLNFLKDFIYLREREREWEHIQVGGGAEGEGETGSSLSRKPNEWVSIPRSQDHDLSWRQMLKQLSHPGAPVFFIFSMTLIFLCNLYPECGTQTHDPKIMTHILYQLRQPGSSCVCLFFFFKLWVTCISSFFSILDNAFST